jgi:ATP-dependent Clp protease protease subunit
MEYGLTGKKPKFNYLAGGGGFMSQKTVQIKFFTSVKEEAIKKLMEVVEQKLTEGATRFVIAISSTGGTVFHGLAAYNFLKGIPAEVITHNFGSVDSIAVVLYCAGSKRFSAPHARFLLHGARANFPAQASLEEKQLEERLKSLKIDNENIAGVISANTDRAEEKVTQDMLDRTTLNAEEAIKYGLVHEIKEELFEKDAELISIQ